MCKIGTQNWQQLNKELVKKLNFYLRRKNLKGQLYKLHLECAKYN